jgi:hypothetical protein
VFALLADDAVMNSLGINVDTLWNSQAPDSPPADRFGVLRWGTEVPSLLAAEKRVSDTDVTIWPYDKNLDYAVVDAINKRWCTLMESLRGQQVGSLAVLGVRWNGDGEDSWDDVYERVFRTSSYIITTAS